LQDRLEVGAVIRRVFDIYVDQAPVLMPVAAAVFVVSGILAEVLEASGPGLALIALLIKLIATTLFTGMVVQLVADVQNGRRDSTPRGLLDAATPVLGKLILVGLVAGIGVVVGLILFVVPGLILFTVWFVAAPVVVLERPAGLLALGRSRALVKGNGWPVFGVIAVLFVAVAVVAELIILAAAAVGTAAALVVSVVLGVLTAPLAALPAAVLYFELRRLASAPAMPGPDPGTDAIEGDPSSPENTDAERAFGSGPDA
jgi:hypothetical protein